MVGAGSGGLDRPGLVGKPVLEPGFGPGCSEPQEMRAVATEPYSVGLVGWLALGLLGKVGLGGGELENLWHEDRPTQQK